MANNNEFSLCILKHTITQTSKLGLENYMTFNAVSNPKHHDFLINITKGLNPEEILISLLSKSKKHMRTFTEYMIDGELSPVETHVFIFDE